MASTTEVKEPSVETLVMALVGSNSALRGVAAVDRHIKMIEENIWGDKTLINLATKLQEPGSQTNFYIEASNACVKRWESDLAELREYRYRAAEDNWTYEDIRCWLRLQ